MAGIPFSSFVTSLPAASALGGSEQEALVQAGAAKRSSLAAIVNQLTAGPIGAGRGTAVVADIPNTTICIIGTPEVITVKVAATITVPDGAAGQVVASVQFQDPDLGLQSLDVWMINNLGVVGLIDLTGAGGSEFHGQLVISVTGGNIDFSTTITGSYGTAQYTITVIVERTYTSFPTIVTL